MNRIHYGTGLAIGLTLGSIFQQQPSQAATLTWDINYHQNSLQVGTGSMSYDDELVTFVATAPLPNIGITVKNALTAFSASVLGATWQLGDSSGISWLNNGMPFQQRFSRYANPIFLAPGWFFGDGAFGTRQFLMDGQLQEPDSLSGAWNQAVVPGYGSNPGYFSGTWTATLRSPEAAAVPEPGIVLGAIASGLFLRKVKGCKQN